ncbi:hypothetical protein [Allorhizocola rhizosphaerae]|uniref:hypothetical protein n=1 Tax=Allorhizocola rhizosphaerae TaxID=1872709 RepID=UPI000E3D7E8E|nr:hypothetical protein [Allorhizocola rhizosphaerae]
MTGKHRDPRTLRLTGVLALGVAIAAAGVLLGLKPSTPGPQTTAATEMVPLTVKPVAVSGNGFQPLYFASEAVSLGTAESADGVVRLLLRTGEKVRELRRVPKEKTPEFAGFVAEGDRVAWVEITQDDRGLWTIDNASANPRLVTTDLGDIALFDKRDDLVLHDGEVSWVAAVAGEQPSTEVRTVSLGGGEVRINTIEGAYSFTGWPWLSTVNLGDNGPIELRNLQTDERVHVPVQTNELVSCSPTWCRSVIIGAGEANTIIELQRPTGKERFRSASGSVAASTVDVAMLDRFDIYSQPGGKLLLFDIETRRTTLVASGVGQVVSRGHMLSWSTGDNETTVWHVLDLRRLTNP